MENEIPANGQHQHTPASYPNLKQAWLFIPFYLLTSVIAAIPLVVFTSLYGWPSGPMIGGVMLLTDLLLIWLLLRWKRQHEPGYHLPFHSPAWIAYPLLLLVALALLYVTGSILSAIPLPDWTGPTFNELKPYPLLMAFLFCVMAPVCEEILLRGIILDGLLKHYSARTAILHSSLIFGIIHFNPPQTLNAFLLGLLLGWVYTRTRSLLPCIFIHFTVKALSLGLSFADPGSETETLYEWINSPLLFFSLLLAAIAVLIGGIRLLDRYLQGQAPPH